MRAEDLPSARAEIDLLRMLPIDGHTEGRAAWLDFPVEALPGFAQVRRAHDAAFITAEIQANTGIERIGIMRSHLHPREYMMGENFSTCRFSQ